MEAKNLGTDDATAALGWSVADLPVAAGYAAALALKL